MAKLAPISSDVIRLLNTKGHLQEKDLAESLEESYASFQVARLPYLLTLLEQRGYLESTNEGWCLTPKGQAQYEYDNRKSKS